MYVRIPGAQVAAVPEKFSKEKNRTLFPRARFLRSRQPGDVRSGHFPQ